MKRSLGKRSSSHNLIRMTETESVSFIRKDKSSGIPKLRACSADRKTLMATPIGRRSCSEDRNSKATPATSIKSYGTERPSRSTTMSSSNRLSSCVGVRTMRDSRPIEDRDWQNNAQRKIEIFLNEDNEGCRILNNGGIRPLTLKLFIDVVDLLLRQIINAGEGSYINKTNYVTELPHMMKTLAYRGKVEKSWLIAVNTARSWCHALACMDFLVSMVITQRIVDPMSLMFPETSIKDEGDIWDYKLLLPYIQESYNLFNNGDPSYEEKQRTLDKKFIDLHTTNDVYHQTNDLKVEIENIEQHSKEYKALVHSEKLGLHELGMKYNNLKDKRAQDEMKQKKLANILEEINNTRRKKEKECSGLRENLLKKQKEKHVIECVVSSQEISPQEMEKLKQRRNSLQREIEAEQKYLTIYNELVMNSSMEVLALKKKNEGLIQDFNIAVMNYMSYGLENLALTNKMDHDDWKTLSSLEAAISAAKKQVQTANCSDSSVIKAQAELRLIEKQVLEERNKLNFIVERKRASVLGKEEIIKRMKIEEDSFNKKILELVIDPEEIQSLEEKKKRAIKMGEQLVMLRHNAVYYMRKCGECFEEHRRKMMDLTEKHKELIAKYSQLARQ